MNKEQDVLSVMEKGKLYTKSMIRTKLNIHYYMLNQIFGSLVNRKLVKEYKLGDDRTVYEKV